MRSIATVTCTLVMALANPGFGIQPETQSQKKAMTPFGITQYERYMEMSYEELCAEGSRRADREYADGWVELEIQGGYVNGSFVDPTSGLYFRGRLGKSLDIESDSYNDRVLELVASKGPPDKARELKQRFQSLRSLVERGDIRQWETLEWTQQGEAPKPTQVGTYQVLAEMVRYGVNKDGALISRGLNSSEQFAQIQIQRAGNTVVTFWPDGNPDNSVHFLPQLDAMVFREWSYRGEWTVIDLRHRRIMFSLEPRRGQDSSIDLHTFVGETTAVGGTRLDYFGDTYAEIRRHGRRRAEADYAVGQGQIELYGLRLFRTMVDHWTEVYVKNCGCVSMGQQAIEADEYNHRLRDLVALHGPPRKMLGLWKRYEKARQIIENHQIQEWVPLQSTARNEDPKPTVVGAYRVFAEVVANPVGEEMVRRLKDTVPDYPDEIARVRIDQDGATVATNIIQGSPDLSVHLLTDCEVLVIREQGRSTTYTVIDLMNRREMFTYYPLWKELHKRLRAQREADPGA